MRWVLEKGNETENGIDFVRYVGMFQVDMQINIPRWQWEDWGSPDRIELTPRPLY